MYVVHLTGRIRMATCHDDRLRTVGDIGQGKQVVSSQMKKYGADLQADAVGESRSAGSVNHPGSRTISSKPFFRSYSHSSSSFHSFERE